MKQKYDRFTSRNLHLREHARFCCCSIWGLHGNLKMATVVMVTVTVTVVW